MNLIQAIKSKKKFRRIGWKKFEFDDLSCFELNTGEVMFKKKDLLADDWEIETDLNWLPGIAISDIECGQSIQYFPENGHVRVKK